MRLGGKVEIDEDDLAHCCAQCGCAGAGPVVTRVCGKLQSREQSQREGKAAQQRRLTATSTSESRRPTRSQPSSASSSTVNNNCLPQQPTHAAPTADWTANMAASHEDPHLMPKNDTSPKRKGCTVGLTLSLILQLPFENGKLWKWGLTL